MLQTLQFASYLWLSIFWYQIRFMLWQTAQSASFLSVSLNTEGLSPLFFENAMWVQAEA